MAKKGEKRTFVLPEQFEIVKARADCEGTLNREALCLRNIYIILDDKGTEITFNNY